MCNQPQASVLHRSFLRYLRRSLCNRHCCPQSTHKCMCYRRHWAKALAALEVHCSSQPEDFYQPHQVSHYAPGLRTMAQAWQTICGKAYQFIQICRNSNKNSRSMRRQQSVKSFNTTTTYRKVLMGQKASVETACHGRSIMEQTNEYLKPFVACNMANGRVPAPITRAPMIHVDSTLRQQLLVDQPIPAAKRDSVVNMRLEHPDLT